MRKVSYRDLILGTARAQGLRVEDVASMTGKTTRSLYRALADPAKIDRQTLQILHRRLGLSWEELMEN